MTSENLYSESLQQTIDMYKQTQTAPLAKLRPSETIPEDIIQLLKLQKVLDKNVSDLKSVHIPPLTFDPTSTVVSHYDALQKASTEKRQQLEQDATMKKEIMRQEHENKVMEANMHNASLSQPYRQKHAELLEYKSSLQHVFDHYNITPLDMKIADTITVKEFQTLIDSSIAVCKKYTVKESSKLFDRLTKPLKGETNLSYVLAYVVVLFALCYIALPILSIPAFVVMCSSIHHLYQDIEALRIANALMAQIDYERFVDKNDVQVVEEVDYTEVDEELQESLSTVEDYKDDKAMALKQLSEDNANIQAQIDEATVWVQQQYAEVLAINEKVRGKVIAKVNAFMQTYKPFPTVQNESAVMCHDYVLGKHEGTIDIRETLPMRNIVFDSTNRETAINNMKLYLCNALLSVRVKQLTVEIYDPVNMCEDFTEFFTQETKPYIKPNNEELPKLIQNLRKVTQQNIIDLDNVDIDTYNKSAEEKDMVPKEYRLLLIISAFDELKKDDKGDQFKEFMKFSAISGVMVWLLDNDMYNNCLWVDGKAALAANAIKYNRDLGKQAVSTFTDALSKFKDKGIDYVTKFADLTIPREKWWTWDTIKGINLHFGLENGDPTRRLPVVLGDANVHAIMGGATGAGKSACINQALISLITMYPPSELQMVYIDFKNVEAAKFTRGYDVETGEWMPPEKEQELREKEQFYTRLSKIPHLRIISGTTDGEYALSVFDFLMQEMSRRQQIINKFGVTKVEEMRDQILAKYNKEHNGNPKKGSWADMRKDWEWYKLNVYDKYGDLPRLLVIFDEFQVMFNTEFVDGRIIDTIKGKITALTKLARAMGCHLWFTSQSMKGTMSQDTMANFSLRCALRCTEDVSTELLGNKASSTIKQKFGFMYTNDSAGQNKDANHLWRVPFLAETKMHEYIEELNKMLVPFNEKHDMAEFYDEKVLVPATEIHKWYTTQDAFKDPRTFIFGERAAFSTNKAPYAINLMDDGGENIILTAFERNDMMNLTLTMIDNIKESGDDATLIINCQDKDTYELMAVDELVPEQFLDLSRPSQDIGEFVDAIASAVDARKEASGPYKPMYIVCIQWERAPGISADANYKLQDKFKDLLRNAPAVGIHFIFACREKLDMPRSIPSACNHHIAGLQPKDSFFFMSKSKCEKLPSVDDDKGLFAVYEYGSTEAKFRIYQHKFTRTLKSREVVIR